MHRYILAIYLFIYFIQVLNSYKSIIVKTYTCNYIHDSNINNVLYIYSSNIIYKQNKIILIGVSFPYKNYKLSCYLYYSDYINICNISQKKLYATNKKVKLTYIALYIKFQNFKRIPNAIKINKNTIPLLIYKPFKKYNIILAIVNFHLIKNYKQVIDVIEISKIYGVEHILIYATSSTLFIKSILFYYMKSKYVELIPFCFNKEIKIVHETGQIEKINDVLYRYMYHTKYIIFNDIDETILLTKTQNYLSFLKYIDNHSSDMYLFKSKLFPYFTKKCNSIIIYNDCCFVKRGYEKYIAANLYKYKILSVHKYEQSVIPIKVNKINKTDGYVRHTRYKGNMCKTNLIDKSLNYLEDFLTKKYIKFENMFYSSSIIFYYGK